MIAPCYFIDLDTQYDFIDRKGAETLPNVQEIVPNLKLLTEHAFRHRISIIAGVEAYETEDFIHSKRTAYCLRKSKGYQKIPATSLKKNIIIDKNSRKTIDYQSLLWKYPQIILEKEAFDFFSNSHSLHLLQSTEIKNCVVYGIALDYGLQICVSRLLKEGFEVWIPVDAVWCINEENREKSLIELRKSGAHMWNTAFILENTITS